MVQGYKNKRLKINTPLRGRAAGSIIRVKVDKKGVLVDPYWRNRLKDAEIDKCCEMISKKNKGGKK